MRRLRQLCTLVALLLSLRYSTSAQDASDPIQLTYAVLAAAQHNDRSKLESLSVSEKEFLQYVSPMLKTWDHPAPDYAAYKKTSNEALDRLLEEMRGQKAKIVKIATLTVSPGAGQGRFPKDFFGSGPNVTLKSDDGHQWMIRPIGTILGLNGIYKVSTY